MNRRSSPHPERGITLTELTITTVLASIVMLGLVAFYMSSQGVWLDSSGQALTQREATQLAEELSERGRASAHMVIDNPAATCQSVTFYDYGGTHSVHFWWSANDGRVHEQKDGTGDAGPVAASTVDQFAFRFSPDTTYVEFDIRMHSPENQVAAVTSGFRMQNHMTVGP